MGHAPAPPALLGAAPPAAGPEGRPFAPPPPTPRSLKVGTFGFPEPNMLQAPSYFKSRSAFAAFCFSLGGPEASLLHPPSDFLFLPTSSERR
eukprot:1379494-Pyramimonas_sp.AAC.1